MSVPTLTTPIHLRMGSPSHRNQARKRKVSERESKKLSLFADDVIVYIENPKDSTKRTVISNQRI